MANIMLQRIVFTPLPGLEDDLNAVPPDVSADRLERESATAGFGRVATTKSVSVSEDARRD